MNPIRKDCTQEQWQKITDEILDHAKLINGTHNGYHSSHEALGVLMEEGMEFLDSIHKNDRPLSVEEAKQLAAGFLVYCALFKENI